MEHKTDSLALSTENVGGPLPQDLTFVGSLSTSVLPEAQVVQNLQNQICELSEKVFQQGCNLRGEVLISIFPWIVWFLKVIRSFQGMAHI